MNATEINKITSAFTAYQIENIHSTNQQIQFDLKHPKAHGRLEIINENNQNQYHGALLPQIGSVIATQNLELKPVLDELVQRLDERIKNQPTDPYAWQKLINLSDAELDDKLASLKTKTTKTAQNYMTDIRFIQAQNYNLNVLNQLLKLWQNNHPDKLAAKTFVEKINHGLTNYATVCAQSPTPLKDIYQNTKIFKDTFGAGPITEKSPIGINLASVDGAYQYLEQLDMIDKDLFNVKKLNNLDIANQIQQTNIADRDSFKTWVKNIIDFFMTIKKSLTNWYRNHQIKVANNKSALIGYYRKGVLRLI